MIEKNELKEIYAGAVDFAVVGMVISAILFVLEMCIRDSLYC